MAAASSLTWDLGARLNPCQKSSSQFPASCQCEKPCLPSFLLASYSARGSLLLQFIVLWLEILCGAASKITTAFRGFGSRVFDLPTVLSNDVLASKQNLLDYHVQVCFLRCVCVCRYSQLALFDPRCPFLATWEVDCHQPQKAGNQFAFGTDLKPKPALCLIRRSSSFLEHVQQKAKHVQWPVKPAWIGAILSVRICHNHTCIYCCWSQTGRGNCLKFTK